MRRSCCCSVLLAGARPFSISPSQPWQSLLRPLCGRKAPLFQGQDALAVARNRHRCEGISYNAIAQPTHNHAMPGNATGLTMVHAVPYASSPRRLTVKHNIQDNNRSHRPGCRAAFPSMQAEGIRARGCRHYYRLVSFQPWRAVPDRGMCARSPIHLDFM
jgi:hypothetical protein